MPRTPKDLLRGRLWLRYVQTMSRGLSARENRGVLRDLITYGGKEM
jgi:hypothetical protein